MWQSQALAGALSSGRFVPDEYGTCSSARATPPRPSPAPAAAIAATACSAGRRPIILDIILWHLPVLAPQARAERSGETRRSCSPWAPGVNRALTGDPHPSGIRLGPEVERDPRGRHGWPSPMSAVVDEAGRRPASARRSK